MCLIDLPSRPGPLLLGRPGHAGRVKVEKLGENVQEFERTACCSYGCDLEHDGEKPF
jgi:hypothetical protein